MSQDEIDFMEFLLAHSTIIQNLHDTQYSIPDDLDYYYQQYLIDHKVDKVKEFLVKHFPNKLEEIQTIIDTEFIDKVEFCILERNKEMNI